MGVASTYQTLLGRLNRLRNRSKNLDLVRGFLIFLLLTLCLAWSALSLEAIFRFNSVFRYSLLIFTISGLTGALSWFVIRPLYCRFFRPGFPDDITLSVAIGRYFHDIRDKLADAIEVYDNQKKNVERYSSDLGNESLIRVLNETKSFNFEEVAATTPVTRLLRILGASTVAATLFFVLFSTQLTSASNRLLNPAIDFSEPSRFSFEISPGSAEVIKGASQLISVRVRGEEPARVDLFVKSVETEAFEGYEMNAGDDARFTVELRDIYSDKIYYVKAENKKSAEFTLSAVERPFVRTLHTQLTYPAYSKLGTQVLDENIGDIVALKGTRVDLTIATNKTTAEAQLIFDDKTRKPVSISGKQVTGGFRVRKAGTYHIFLKDKQGLINPNPIEYRVSVLEDRFPLVQITFPGQDVDLNKDRLLPLTIDAQDDFGISKLRLGFHISHGGTDEGELRYLPLALQEPNSDKVLANQTWDMTELNLQPEDIVSYYAEVFDNDSVSGPKSARSTTFQVRFPSIYEQYDEVQANHEDAVDELQNLFEESKALKETLDDVVQEMKRDPDLNWEQKQEVRDAAQSQSEMMQKLEQLQESLDNMVERMEQNELVSPETLRKYQELQALIEKMMTPEMRKTLEELQRSMDELDPEEMKDAMEKFAASQEDFLKGMERTLNLLKKLQVEQQLDESLNKARELARRQEELNQDSSSPQGQRDPKKYAEEQQDIRKDTEDLAKELNQLSESMNEFSRMPQKQVDSAQKQLQSDASQQMQQAASQFQSGQMQSGNQTGQRISQSLQQSVQQLQEARDQLTEQEKKKIMQALRRSSHDLLGLSKRQEELMKKTKRADRNTPGINDMADSQQDLRSGLNRVGAQLYDLSQNTFFVTPDIGKALGKASKGMQESLDGLEGRAPGKASKNQNNAMSGLNEAISSLRSSMQSLSGAQSGIGFEEMMQRMLSMSNKQQGINQQTSQLGGQGGLSPEQKAQAARLAAEQGAVRKSLEQLMKEAGSNSGLQGDLKQVSQDMEDVVKELAKNNIDRPTLNRQKQILSRLLDAQRSVHNRDYSKKRQAEVAKSYETISPTSLSLDKDRRKERLKNDLLRALKENYSRDYEDLIQKYFEALSRSETTKGIEN